jgi:CheY-like chemotaxis protein
MIQTVILVEDLAADRTLAARVLRNAGWTVQAARTTCEGEQYIAMVPIADVGHTVVVTDLHMPRDPMYGATNVGTIAGAQWALQLRARMEHGVVPRLPIVALTALTEREVRTTALAFGCDAVVLKPVTPDLAQRITQAIQTCAAEDSEPSGAASLIRLLRSRLAEAVLPSSLPQITEAEITQALLAYHRRGLVGLGESNLAALLSPHISNILSRGEYVYTLLVNHLTAIMQVNASASLALLQGELVQHTPPAVQAAELGLSVSEYYRRRREAIGVLRDLLTKPE